MQFIIENGKKLRNVVPRQGTEIINNVEYRPDGHALRNVVPRQGTEIIQNDISEYLTISEKLRNVVPRQGTETRTVLVSGC